MFLIGSESILKAWDKSERVIYLLLEVYLPTERFQIVIEAFLIVWIALTTVCRNEQINKNSEPK